MVVKKKAPAKKAPAKKAPAKKAAAKKPAVKKVVAKKAPVKKAVAKKAPAKKAPVKKAVVKKAVVKKAPVKKVAAKKAPAKKVAAKPAVAKLAAMKTTAVTGKPMTKTQIVEELMGATGLQRKDVNAVLDNLSTLVDRHVKKRSVGKFVLPGLLQVKTVKKPARKAQKNVPNPFRPGETMNVAAKPASTAVKVLPLKKLKDMAK
jgi:nucleoid DNA-binding protein